VGKAAGVTAPPDLLKQISTPNAAFSPAARQIILVVGWRAWLWRHCLPICRRTLIQPFLDAASAEPGLLGDIMDSLPSIVQRMDAVKKDLSRTTVCLPEVVSMLCDLTLPAWTTDDGRTALVLASRCRQQRSRLCRKRFRKGV
jgi:hypothetical protein